VLKNIWEAMGKMDFLMRLEHLSIHIWRHSLVTIHHSL